MHQSGRWQVHRLIGHVVPLPSPLLWPLLAVSCLVLLGCGRGEGLVPVRGKVTLGGGPWPKPGMIFFTALEPAAGFSSRPGAGSFGTDGSFRVTTIKEGDGLVPGKYRVYVTCWEVAPSPIMGPGAEGKSYVPPKYRSPATSDLELTVEPGQRSLEVQYDLPLERLSGRR